MIVVADAGPLIYLSAVGKFELLRELYQSLVVPATVYEEVVVHGAGLPGSRELADATWIETAPHDEASLLWQLLSDELDDGEAAALWIASTRRAELVLVDDRAARIAARRLKLDVKGTLGVLIEAKVRGHISAVSPLLQGLVDAGMWIAEDVVRVVCARAGEDPPELER